MILINGNAAVQTFYLISGWLLCYHFLLTFEGRKHIKPGLIILALINRYLR